MASDRKQVQFRYQEEICYCEHGEALEGVGQKTCGYPIPRNVQGQTGWSSEKTGLVKSVSVHRRDVGMK